MVRMQPLSQDLHRAPPRHAWLPHAQRPHPWFQHAAGLPGLPVVWRQLAQWLYLFRLAVRFSVRAVLPVRVASTVGRWHDPFGNTNVGLVAPVSSAWRGIRRQPRPPSVAPTDSPSPQNPILPTPP